MSVSVADVLEDQLDRIQRHDARLRSVVTLDADGARRRAAEADQALAVARCGARCTGSE
jgi:Asp-tRNA(Asn)/Glu-tRNA(Gln) amidotransferase A subunit family amidase